METAAPVTGDYPTEPRLPLLTAAEARELIGLLLHFDDGTVRGRQAGQAAADLARRLPTE
ncbi:hypothetical protein ACFZDF_30570 [Streptomyces sp. NPDC007910]|uniref:hypothetical protein n=1 Tax=Streptomyces sp. NPDC007910 TaxID=3364790 RepID=UPI0036E206D7